MNVLENKSGIKKYFGELERLFKKGTWGANSIGTDVKCCIYKK